MRPQFGGDDRAAPRAARAAPPRGRGPTARRAARIGGIGGEALREALHAAAFVVDADRQLGLAQRADLAVSAQQLLGVS